MASEISANSAALLVGLPKAPVVRGAWGGLDPAPAPTSTPALGSPDPEGAVVVVTVTVELKLLPLDLSGLLLWNTRSNSVDVNVERSTFFVVSRTDERSCSLTGTAVVSCLTGEPSTLVCLLPGCIPVLL